MTTIDPAVISDVLDRLAIQDLMIKYVYLLDTLQFERSADEIFTEDATDNHGEAWGGQIHGREAIKAAFLQSGGIIQGSQHSIGASHVSVKGDEASGFFYIQAWNWLTTNSDAGPNRPADMLVVAAYVNRFRRSPDGWRVSEQKVHTFGPGGGIAYGSLPDAFGGTFGGDFLKGAHADD